MESYSNMNTINGCGWYDSYRKMKPKFRQVFDDNTYYGIAMNTFLTMFDYDERIFRPELLDLILHDNGCCALIKTEDSDYTPCFCNFVGGERYSDGFFKNAFCVLLNGESKTFTDWRNNPEIFVFFNSMLKCHDTFIEKYCYLLTNCDISLDANMIFSRKKPIPIARDQRTKNQIDTIFDDLDKGNIKTILTEPTITDFVDGSSKSIDVLNLTEVESSKYIQYLSQLHDNLISRLFFHMGLSMSDINKQAQVTTAELNKNKATALAFINAWKKPREQGIKEIERKTGVKLYFSLSPIWAVEMENQLYSDREKDDNEDKKQDENQDENARRLAEESDENENE